MKNKKNKPNSHESMRSNSWSELPSDLLGSVFERLSFADFQRAKSVCSSWHSVPKKTHTPWLILFPDQNNKNYCMLFNPKEKDKFYKTRDLGLEFGKSVCVATYGNWLLMRNHRYNLYIVNLFTQETISLPKAESERLFSRWLIDMRSPVFWIDDKTKDYIVLFGRGRCGCVVYTKKGDNYWKPIPDTLDCLDLVYKDHKLYFLSRFSCFKIFDFSVEIPRELSQCTRTALWLGTKLVVTAKGDVLAVQKTVRPPPHETWYFSIYRFYASGLYKEPELVSSLGDEAMLFDSGVTFRVNGLEGGVVRNSIYYNRSHERRPNDLFLFNVTTQWSVKLHEFVYSSVQLSTARWFFPSFN